jgi:hypothetical protein
VSGRSKTKVWADSERERERKRERESSQVSPLIRTHPVGSGHISVTSFKITSIKVLAPNAATLGVGASTTNIQYTTAKSEFYYIKMF